MSEISKIKLPGSNTVYDIKDSALTSRVSNLETTISSSLQKGVANGVAELDSTGKVPSSQLPSYVDDVLEYSNQSSFPTTGETGKIYIALNTNKTYRWSGSAYTEISTSLALGETSSTAYRGDRGKTAYDHSQLTSGNPHNVTKSNVGLGNVDNTSDSTKKTNFTGSIASENTGFITGGDAYTALAGKAPTSHASTSTTYGVGTNANYGHVKLSDSTSSTSSTNGGIAATPAAVKSAYDLANGKYTKPSGGIPASDLASGVIPSVPSATTTTPKMDGTAAVGSETKWAKGDHVHPTDTSRAPTSHASTSTTYGTGTDANYGHVKLSASTSSTSGTSGGIAATPSAVKSAYDLASNHKYWGSVEATSAAQYDKEPIVKTITIGNGSGATAPTKSAKFVYDMTLETVSFVFT